MSEKSIPAQISEAIRNSDINAIHSLFNADPDQITAYTPFGGQTWLGFAAQIGKFDTLKALIDIGIDVNTSDKFDNRRPIWSAAANNHLEVVRYLLEKGTQLDVSKSIRNALFAAVIGRSPSIVKLLLKSGIDSQVTYNSDTMKNMDALAFALMRGEKECAEIIARHNTNGDETAAKAAIDRAYLVAINNAT